MEVEAIMLEDTVVVLAGIILSVFAFSPPTVDKSEEV